MGFLVFYPANDRKFARKINLNNQTFGPDEKEKKEKEAKKRDAEAIIKSLDEQIAVKKLDFEADGKLTEGQRLLAKTLADIEAGHIKVTAAERQTIEAKSAKLTALEREITMQAVVDKAADDEQSRLAKRLESLDEEMRSAERQADLYGLTAAQISVVTQARLEDALAVARQKENNEGEVAVLEEELRLRERITGALVKVEEQKQVADELNEKTKKGSDAARELGLTFSSAFEDAVAGGKKFSDILRGLAQDIARLVVRKTVTEPLVKAFEGFDFGSLFANADGGVYSSPSLSAYSGKIYNSPHVFAFAQGAGVFGEAGPEAIMPLKRGADGRLGVSAAGGGTVVNIIEAPGRGGEVSRRQEGGVDIVEVWVDRVKSSIAGDIVRGDGVVPSAMSSTYGLNRVAGAY